MCGIMYCGDLKISENLFKSSFEKIKYRGPDMSKILKSNKGYFGFHRLAIMDLSENGMQPFTLNNDILICNGEVYEFQKLKDQLKNKYEFKSKSDCEILLPLYNEYKFKMFNMLDSEFVLVLYDSLEDEIIAARDPIGIRPMFYGYTINNKICFASEAKALVDICNIVKPFPIGSYYYKNKFHKYNNITKIKNNNYSNIDEIYKEINERLTNGVIKRLDADAPVGFLLSGGLDSSLVCAIASKYYKKYNKKIKTFAIGMDKDPIDLKYAKEVSKYLDTIHTEVIMTKKDIINSLEEVIYTLETYDITTIRASLGMYLLCKYIKNNTDIKVILTGEISDELFGYKYSDFAPNSKEFQKESEKRVKELYMYDVLRADRCISSNGLEGRVPFGDLKFVDYVLNINPELKLNKYNKGKYLLRKSFTDNYLPEDILFREKAAFSDAVGHSMVDYLKEYANNKYTDEEFNQKKELYNYYKKPFTKESLLYREIFEKHYKNHADMIKDYWMPNKKWVKVNDPSARVLSNYGDSAK